MAKTKAQRRREREQRKMRAERERLGPTLMAEKYGELPPAARTETTQVQRFGTRHQLMLVKIVTGFDPTGKVLWVTEAIHG